MCSDSLGTAHLRWLAKRLRPSSPGNRLHLSAGPRGKSVCPFLVGGSPASPSPRCSGRGVSERVRTV
jgi:hypothetical protein